MRFWSSVAAVGLIACAAAAAPAHADDLTLDMQACIHSSVMTELLKPHPRMHVDDDDVTTAAAKGILKRITDTCGLRASEWPAGLKLVSGILERLQRPSQATEAAKPNDPPATSNDDSIQQEEVRKARARAASGYRDPPGTRVIQ